MVTIKDIARAAGVSQGTVSNVINKTGKVSSTKINLVEEAARKLGYKTNAQAQKLKLGGSSHVAVVLPSLQARQYFDFFEVLRSLLEDADFDVSLYTTDDIEAKEKKCIEKIYTTRPTAIISVSCLSSCTLYDGDIPTIFVDRIFQSNSAYHINVGFSFYNAGVDIAKYAVARGYSKLALFSSPKSLYDYAQFERGLCDGVGSSAAITRFLSDAKLIMNKALELSSQDDRFDAIIAADSDRAKALAAANKFSKNKSLPEIICLSDKNIFESDDYTAYQLDYRKLGMELAARIIAYAKNKTPIAPFSMKNDGFPEKQKSTRLQQSLNLLTLDSPAAEALKRLLPAFEATSGISVNLTVLSFDELYETVSTLGNSGYFDLIRVDMAWLSQLAEKIFLPFDKNSQFYKTITSKFLPDLINDYSLVKGIAYTLPFDPSAQLLFYNKDLFDNATVKRLYYEAYREELAVPTTYAAHDKIAAFFTKSLNPNSPTDFGTTLAFGTAGVAACDFLPRVFDKYPDVFNTAAPLTVNTPEILAILNEYISTYEYTDKVSNTWWRNAIEPFANGKAAMITVFMNHASQIINSKHSKIVGRVGFAPSPSSHPLLGGGAIGISKTSNKLEAAYRFLEWVYSDEISNAFTFFGGLSPNASVFDNPEILKLYPWLSIAKNSFSNGARRINYISRANFCEKKFENIVGIAVRSAITRTVSSETALDFAQQQIDEAFNC